MRRFLHQLFSNWQASFNNNIPVDFLLYAEKAIQLIAASDGQLEDEQTLALFEAQEIPHKEAIGLLLFLPIAFCRHMLPQIDWPNHYFKFISESKSLKLFHEKTRDTSLFNARCSIF